MFWCLILEQYKENIRLYRATQGSPAESIEDIQQFHSQESNTIQCIKWTNYPISGAPWDGNVGGSGQHVSRDADATGLPSAILQKQVPDGVSAGISLRSCPLLQHRHHPAWVHEEEVPRGNHVSETIGAKAFFWKHGGCNRTNMSVLHIRSDNPLPAPTDQHY